MERARTAAMIFFMVVPIRFTDESYVVEFAGKCLWRKKMFWKPWQGKHVMSPISATIRLAASERASEPALARVNQPRRDHQLGRILDGHVEIRHRRFGHVQQEIPRSGSALSAGIPTGSCRSSGSLASISSLGLGRDEGQRPEPGAGIFDQAGLVERRCRTGRTPSRRSASARCRPSARPASGPPGFRRTAGTTGRSGPWPSSRPRR